MITFSNYFTFHILMQHLLNILIENIAFLRNKPETSDTIVWSFGIWTRR